MLAAAAVDTWDDAAQKNFPCLIADVMTDIAAMSQTLQTAKVTIPQLVIDAIDLAKTFAPQCVK
jgi:hypothetical protein